MRSTLQNGASALLPDPFRLVFRELNRDDSWNGNGSRNAFQKIAPLSMWEDDGAVYIEMDVPGLSTDDLNVAIEKGHLVIQGQRPVGERPTDALHEERFFGQFERRVALNEYVDPSTIEATLRDGVLHLKLTKKLEAQRQKIAINHVRGEDSRRIESTTK